MVCFLGPSHPLSLPAPIFAVLCFINMFFAGYMYLHRLSGCKVNPIPGAVCLPLNNRFCWLRRIWLEGRLHGQHLSSGRGHGFAI